MIALQFTSVSYRPTIIILSIVGLYGTTIDLPIWSLVRPTFVEGLLFCCCAFFTAPVIFQTAEHAALIKCIPEICEFAGRTFAQTSRPSPIIFTRGGQNTNFFSILDPSHLWVVRIANRNNQAYLKYKANWLRIDDWLGLCHSSIHSCLFVKKQYNRSTVKITVDRRMSSPNAVQFGYWKPGIRLEVLEWTPWKRAAEMC